MLYDVTNHAEYYFSEQQRCVKVGKMLRAVGKMVFGGFENPKFTPQQSKVCQSRIK